MPELISAEEARQQLESLESHTAKVATELLIAAISKELDRGGRAAWVYANHRTLVLAKKIAELKGYTATLTQCQRDGDSLKVEW